MNPFLLYLAVRRPSMYESSPRMAVLAGWFYQNWWVMARVILLYGCLW